MDRTEWLREKRRRSEERMDILFAPIYDDKWGGYINPSHAAMLDDFLACCPPGGQILDAACGTGKYWPPILTSGRQVTGCDQSQQMLARAHAKFPAVPVIKLGLQELDYDEAFDGITCIDAMEMICPEDWPRVLANFARALRPGALLYFTVELAAPEEMAAAFAAGQEQGLPVVQGEWAHEGGYHYYPDLDQVRTWTGEAGFTSLKETEGDGYAHFLIRRPYPVPL